MAFVFFHALEYFAPLLGRATLFGRILFSFSLACTVGVFWEFAEWLSDYRHHTHIQISIWETMCDLAADAMGASLALLAILCVCAFSRRSCRPAQQKAMLPR